MSDVVTNTESGVMSDVITNMEQWCNEFDH